MNAQRTFMNEYLTKLKVNNFKSLKDFEMPLKQFNVIIGSNGSGKSNILESVKLMMSSISPKRFPVYPFAYWGGYENIVWSGMEHEPISFQIEYSINEHEIKYIVLIASPNNNNLDIQEERLYIKNYLDIVRKLDKIYYNVNQSFASFVNENVDIEYKKWLKYDFTILHNNCDLSIMSSIPWTQFTHGHEKFNLLHYNAAVENSYEHQPCLLASPRLKDKELNSLYEASVNYLTGENNIIILSQIDYDLLRHSAPLDPHKSIKENGDGTINLLFQWFNENQRLPQGISLALDALFPNWQISFIVTQKGNIMLNVHDGTTKLVPFSIPDGFYKILVILVAVELCPKILMIDEVENSLHGESIEYVMSLLKTIDSVVIVATHSPLVIDSVDIGDLVISERDHNGTTCRRIENIDTVKKDLADRGITPSESWLYGDLR